MKQFFKTIYGRITVIFLMLIVVFGSLEVLLLVNASVSYVCEATQKLNYNLASQLVRNCEPVMAKGMSSPELRETVQQMKSMNQHVEVYILDGEGNIISSFNKEQPLRRGKVDMAPIRAYLAEGAFKSLPIYGDDPLDETRTKIFSVAPIKMGSKPQSYLYVTLASARYDLASKGVLGSYILRNSVLILGLMLLFAALLGSVLFFYLTKRVHNMTKVVRNFEEGKYDQRVDVRSDDEVGQLAGAFNHMADTIQRNLKELEKNDSLRRELIANISHDLRSPLSSIQGYVETVLMKEEQLTAEQRREFLEIILKNAVHLNNLVRELFELSKLDARQAVPDPEPFSIAELAQDVALKFQPQAEARKIHLLTKLPVKLPLVYADIGMIERALSNLIDNALRFTPPGGKVEVRLEKTNRHITVRISDTGSGIPEEDLPFVFDRFYRVEKSRTRESGGSGLGLAIAKKIIDAHGGEIKAESRSVKGTQFSFSLEIFRQSSENNLARKIKSDSVGT